MTELAYVSTVHARDTGSKLGMDKIFSDNVCVRFEFIYVKY
jgi:hypothetical protein